MKAAVIHKTGDLPRYEDIADPVPQNGEQLIHVRAASIKNLDRMLVTGTHYGEHHGAFPAIPGVDGIGTLEDGTRVYAGARPPYGMLAEKAIAMKGYCIPIPDIIDDILAAALPNPGVSAWLSLQWRGQIKQGDTVFILGATGVTGKLAIQLAREMGAGKIIAAGRNEKVLRLLPRLGADEVISLSRPAEAIRKDISALTQHGSPDIVLDYVWGQPAEILLQTLTNDNLYAEAHTTRYIQIGEMAGPVIRLSAGTLRSAGIELYGQGGGSVPGDIMAKIPVEILPALIKWAGEGKISMDTEVFTLQDIEKAWQRGDIDGRRIVISIS